MRYSHLLHIAFYLYAAALLILFVLRGETHLVDIRTILLTFGMVLSLSLALIVPFRRSTELRIAFVTFAALFLLPSVPAYLLYPGLFPLGGMDWAQVGVEDVNRALLFVILGTLAAIAGLAFGSNFVPYVDRRSRSIPPEMPIGRLIAVGLLFVGLELYIGIRFGRFTTEINGDEGGGPFYLTRLISSDAFAMVALTVLGYRWTKLTPLKRLALTGTVMLVIVHKTLVGSRSSVLAVLMVLLAIMLDRYGDFHISRRAITIVIAGALATLIVFPAATIVRDYWMLSTRASYPLSMSEFLSRRAAGAGVQDPLDLVYAIFSRLSGLDPVATIATGRSYEKEKYVSLSNDAKSFINIIVPGTPWPEAIERSKSFGVVYRGYPEAYLESNYVTWMWTLWGDCYGLFGFFGGLAWMFVVCTVFSAFFAQAARMRLRGSVFVRVLVLFFTYAFVASFGLDTFGATMIYYLLPIFVVLLLCGVFTPYLLWPLRLIVEPVRRRVVVGFER